MAKVLIVDDDEIYAEVVAALLSSRGHEVLLAHNGEDGIAAAKRERPDIVIMDLEMPVLNGVEATRAIKDDADLANIPVLVLTSHSEAKAQEDVQFAKADGFVNKITDMKSLVPSLEAALENARRG